jgi:periplasmic protein CpxP/Spy
MKLLSGMKLIAVLAVAAMSTVVWGQMPEYGAGPMGQHRPPMERSFGPPSVMFRWWNEPKMVEKLKLTEDQRKQFDQILEMHSEKLIDLKANLEKAELPMHTLMDAEQPDEAKIMAQIDKLVAARAALEKANASFLLAIRAKLTPDQWKQLKAMHDAHQPLGEGQRDRRALPDHGGQKNGDRRPEPGPQGALKDGLDGDGPEAGPGPAPSMQP